MTFERAIEYIKAVKAEYPDDEVSQACDKAIACLEAEKHRSVSKCNPDK